MAGSESKAVTIRNSCSKVKLEDDDDGNRFIYILYRIITGTEGFAMLCGSVLAPLLLLLTGDELSRSVAVFPEPMQDQSEETPPLFVHH